MGLMRHDIVPTRSEVQQWLPETSFERKQRGEGQPGASLSVCSATTVLWGAYERANTHTVTGTACSCEGVLGGADQTLDGR